MMELPKHSAGFEAPDLSAVIVTEITRAGWRGLTEDGEILNVNAHVNGAPVNIPDSLSIARGGEVIGYRRVEQKLTEGVIDKYLQHLTESTRLTRACEHEAALEQSSLALSFASTALARYNRAMIMLALGYFAQGFDEFARCERESELFMRPLFRAALINGLEPWRGQNLRGKTILLIHDHGFGDTIMCLRYIAKLREMGAFVIVQSPPELESLIQQHAPTTRELTGANYVCSILMLMQVLQEFPGEWRGPYIKLDPALVTKWRTVLPPDRKKIGIACNVGKAQDGDYPRACPIALFEKHLWHDVELVNVEQATASCDLRFDDFADCAALMSLMDEIVTVDTAAAHLAGAIGHPKITLLLSHWHSWRWRMPLYPNVKICMQDSDGDWESAFAKRALP